jgi:single-strand DNA-binding protein
MTITTTAPATMTAVAGNLTAGPELRYSPKGAAWAAFNIATNRRRRNADGTWEEAPPEFYEVVCFGTLAENACASLGKGSRVVVAGTLEERVWTARDGTERHGWKLVADDLGASLRFATAAVARAERRGPREPAEGQAPDPLAEAALRYSEEEGEAW